MDAQVLSNLLDAKLRLYQLLLQRKLDRNNLELASLLSKDEQIQEYLDSKLEAEKLKEGK